MNPDLLWDVFVAPRVRTSTPDVPPGETETRWSPISSTLIYGERDAVLVDPLLTDKQGESLAAWVEQHGKRLTTIYATHGHGDHFFGATALLPRFPGARFVATPRVVERMRRELSDKVSEFWNTTLPGQLPRHPVIAEPLEDDAIRLEGRALVPIEAGHTDTDNTTVLHVPDIGLVVAGDVVYNGVHVYLAESDSRTRQEWLDALDRVAALRPRAVIAGHKKPGNDDNPGNIAETQRYIRDFDRLISSAATQLELYEQMLALYPDRVNPGALWLSVAGAQPRPSSVRNRTARMAS
jgi:glyoxylase-like metal-dependent hydrolase (beta-lactamase superfamily II)